MKRCFADSLESPRWRATSRPGSSVTDTSSTARHASTTFELICGETATNVAHTDFPFNPAAECINRPPASIAPRSRHSGLPFLEILFRKSMRPLLKCSPDPVRPRQRISQPM